MILKLPCFFYSKRIVKALRADKFSKVLSYIIPGAILRENFEDNYQLLRFDIYFIM